MVTLRYVCVIILYSNLNVLVIGNNETANVTFPPLDGLVSQRLLDNGNTTGNEIHQSVGGPIDMEIISIEVRAGVGNSVVLSWGEPMPGYNFNWTYGVYYGTSIEEARKDPKLTTKGLKAVVSDLDYCTKYVFAVRIMDANSSEIGPEGYFRSVGTYVDELAHPENLQVDFIPGEFPCLLIKWAASCPNIGRPLGYLVTVSERNPVRMTIITEPKTTAADLGQMVRVFYGKIYDIKVSTDIKGSESTETKTYEVPHFLQPFRVRVSSQKLDNTYMIFWREPYVPYYIGPYYYVVYAYQGKGFKNQKYESFDVTKPIFIFLSSNNTINEYTFMVGLRSYDGAFKSYLSEPIYINSNGETEVLSLS